MWESTTWQVVSAILYIMNLGLAIYAATSMILRRQDPVKTLSWVTVLITLPLLGLILYFFFGMHYRRKWLYSFKGNAEFKLRKSISSAQRQKIKEHPEILGELQPYKKIMFQNLNNSYTLIEKNDDMEFFFSGRDALDAMYAAIEQAKNHVHLQSYIFLNDKTGSRFAELLMEKARKGVEVRVIYDGVGSISLKEDFIRRMTAAGVEMLCFSKVKFSMIASRLNYRNHRKILIVDGTVGFLGGVNIADRYYYGTQMGDWHDTHIKVRGESVFSLQASFLLDRYYILHRKIKMRKKYYPTLQTREENPDSLSKDIATQIVVSGPDSSWAGIMQCFFSTITAARKYIYMVTPYFTPNETILNALKIAALGNIDVRIMLPEKSDTRIAHYSTRSYISELLDAGVKIYLFKQGFNHSKVVSIDGEISIVGSANMDMRSFEHNFEIMSVIYNSGCASIVEKQFLKDCTSCRMVQPWLWARRSRGEKLAESVARLCSPLL